MPVTRKIVEILAPRTTLAAPEDPGAGDELLAAVRALDRTGASIQTSHSRRHCGSRSTGELASQSVRLSTESRLTEGENPRDDSA